MNLSRHLSPSKKEKKAMNKTNVTFKAWYKAQKDFNSFEKLIT